MERFTVYRIEDKMYWEGRPKLAFQPVERWHSGGRRIIYTAESASLAILERLKWFLTRNVIVTHLGERSFIIWRADLLLHEPPEEIDTSALPPNWWAAPAWLSPETQEVGNKWLDENRSLLLKVPSATVPTGLGWNYLLNPQHADFNRTLQQATVAEIDFDFQHYLS